MVKRRNILPKEQMKAEGQRLKAIYLQRKRDWGITQEVLCGKINLNQGFLTQMFAGTTPIPFEWLLDLAIALQFDPREVRPEADELIQKIGASISGDDLERAFQSLNDQQRQDVLRYIEFLKSKDIG